MTKRPVDRLAAWCALEQVVRERLRREHDRATRRRLWRALAEAWRITGHPNAAHPNALRPAEGGEARLDAVFGAPAAPAAPTLDEILSRPEPDLADPGAQARQGRRAGRPRPGQ